MPFVKKKLSTIQFLSLGYIITILLGTLLLMLPFASKGEPTNFIDSLFTATSATCVTGLVVFDTFTHWTIFGQVVILALIQIGGLGFMTIITLICMLFKKNIGLYERTILMQSAGSYNISGVIKLIRKIMIGTFIFEFIGAVILATRFIPVMGAQGIWYGVFHSISAFCNAGFDLMGQFKQFSSFTAYYNDWVVNITLMSLIVIGGLGFIVWSDIYDNKFHFKKYQMHTKIVLVFNSILIFGGALLFFIFEYNNLFKDYSLSEKILCSLFCSVTPRTAGFNTIDYANISTPGGLLTMMFMFIGGNSGSTAGGVKVTTVVAILANLVANAKNKEEIVLFKRRISDKIVKQSSSLFIVYVMMVLLGTLVISVVQPQYNLQQILFESISAVGTVGLSMGITQQLEWISEVVLILLMYSGRLGAFTLFSVFFKNQKELVLKKPEGKILVG